MHTQGEIMASITFHILCQESLPESTSLSLSVGLQFKRNPGTDTWVSLTLWRVSYYCYCTVRLHDTTYCGWHCALLWTLQTPSCWLSKWAHLPSADFHTGHRRSRENNTRKRAQRQQQKTWPKKRGTKSSESYMFYHSRIVVFREKKE